VQLPWRARPLEGVADVAFLGADNEAIAVLGSVDDMREAPVGVLPLPVVGSALLTRPDTQQQQQQQQGDAKRSAASAAPLSFNDRRVLCRLVGKAPGSVAFARWLWCSLQDRYSRPPTSLARSTPSWLRRLRLRPRGVAAAAGAAVVAAAVVAAVSAPGVAAEAAEQAQGRCEVRWPQPASEPRAGSETDASACPQGSNRACMRTLASVLAREQAQGQRVLRLAALVLPQLLVLLLRARLLCSRRCDRAPCCWTA
jgi:hypothetical protein